jgi:hypothetical protein
MGVAVADVRCVQVMHKNKKYQTNPFHFLGCTLQFNVLRKFTGRHTSKTNPFSAVLQESVKLQTIAFQFPLHKCQPIPAGAGDTPSAFDVGCSAFLSEFDRQTQSNRVQANFFVQGWTKIPVAITPFFDSLLGLSGRAGEGNGPRPPSREGRLVLRSGCCEGGGHNNTEINPVFRGMSQVKSRDLNQRKYCD